MLFLLLNFCSFCLDRKTVLSCAFLHCHVDDGVDDLQRRLRHAGTSRRSFPCRRTIYDLVLGVSGSAQQIL